MAPKYKWWLGTESNRRHEDFQSSALPTELPSQTYWLRGQDSNLRPSGYEPDELPTAPPRVNGAPNQIRTGDLILTMDALYRLSYGSKGTGEAGIEPASDGVKVRCLTTWLLPNIIISMVEGEGFEPSKLSQRIYSPPQLATLVPLQN